MSRIVGRIRLADVDCPQASRSGGPDAKAFAIPAQVKENGMFIAAPSFKGLKIR